MESGEPVKLYESRRFSLALLLAVPERYYSRAEFDRLLEAALIAGRKLHLFISSVDYSLSPP